MTRSRASQSLPCPRPLAALTACRVRLPGAALFVALTLGLMVPVHLVGATMPQPIQRGGDIDGEAAGDQSGQSVALSDDGATVAIGAHQNGVARALAGHVRVYRWNGSAWVKRGGDIDGEAAVDLSGFSVALSDDGDTVAIGAPFNGGAGQEAGHVRVYRWDGSAWVKRGGDIDGEAAGDQSGSSVALSDDGATVAIGAPNNDGAGSDAGHVRVYRWDGSAWVKRGGDIDGETADDRSGQSVALSADGDTVAVGAVDNDVAGSDAGHVRVYQWDATDGRWEQLGTDIDGEAAGDLSGWSVALSDDGDTVAIGAYGNDVAGLNAGHTRIYQWDATDGRWEQLGTDIDGEAAGDQSGWSVALSDDGDTVAIGAFLNDGAGSDAGHVRVFTLITQTPLSSDASLSGLSVSEGSLSPVFASGTTSYAVGVGNGVSSVSFTPTVTDAGASVTVDGVAVGSGVASAAVALAVGANVVDVVVTAEDGSTRTYTVTVTRASASSPEPSLPAVDSGSPELRCGPAMLQVGGEVVCEVSDGAAGIDILWRAAYGPVFAETGVTLDGSGAGEFSFVVPAEAVGSELTVELVEWIAPVSLGVVGGPVPSSVPSGEGPVPVWPPVLVALVVFVLLGRGMRTQG